MCNVLRVLTVAIALLQGFDVHADVFESSRYRSGSGKPGPDYWQQRADYEIAARLEPETHTVSASAKITYTNNSPDTLDFVWLHLEQNIFKPGSRGSIYHPLKGGEVETFAEAGFNITSIAVITGKKRITPDTMVDGTRMRIDLPEPLEGGGSVLTIEIAWMFVVPQNGLGRMGREQHRDGWVYAISQWFPRVAVYDDIRGWNPAPYTPWRNFYLDYGDFDVSITAPAGMIVVGTGHLQRLQDVLTSKQQRRLDKARSSVKPVFIIEPTEVSPGYEATTDRAMKTWRFIVSNVRDFVWAASGAFVWEAAGWQDTLIMSVYPKDSIGDENAPGWEVVTNFAREVVASHSKRFGRYPYPILVNVASADGQEYPMVHFSPAGHRGDELFSIVGHEIAHTWFPMLVGFDEQRHPWMDEGIVTFMDYYMQMEQFGRLLASRRVMGSAESMARMMQQPFANQPIAIPAESLQGPDIRSSKSFLHYKKAGYGLVLLREYILGPERFDDAIRVIIQRWANKHPRPVDFFRTIENVSGEELTWFWQSWYYSADLLDQEVDSLLIERNGTRIFLNSNETLHMPVELEIVFANDDVEHLTLPVSFWSSGNSNSYLVKNPLPIRKVEIDPRHLLPDIKRDNNTWDSEVFR